MSRAPKSNGPSFVHTEWCFSAELRGGGEGGGGQARGGEKRSKRRRRSARPGWLGKNEKKLKNNLGQRDCFKLGPSLACTGRPAGAVQDLRTLASGERRTQGRKSRRAKPFELRGGETLLLPPSLPPFSFARSGFAWPPKPLARSPARHPSATLTDGKFGAGRNDEMIFAASDWRPAPARARLEQLHRAEPLLLMRFRRASA